MICRLTLSAQLALALGSSGCVVTTWLGQDQAALAPAGPEGLTQRINSEGQEGNGRVDHFAVLIGANTELRHRGNLSMAYQVLVEQGYAREQIYILDSEGESLFFPSTDVTTRDTVRRLFEHLRRIVEPEDTLLIYVTGHGRRVTAEQESNGERSTLGVSTILLNAREELSEWELAAMLDGLSPKNGIAFFDQCYGAIFATTLDTCSFVSITAAAEDETSYGVSFPRAFWGAFRAHGGVAGETPPLSVRAAYDIARASDRATKLGYNRPDFKDGCVSAARLTLLGEVMPEPTVLTAAEGSSATGIEGPPAALELNGPARAPAQE